MNRSHRCLGEGDSRRRKGRRRRRRSVVRIPTPVGLFLLMRRRAAAGSGRATALADSPGCSNGAGAGRGEQCGVLEKDETALRLKKVGRRLEALVGNDIASAEGNSIREIMPSPSQMPRWHQP